MFQIPFEPQSHLPGARRLLAENVLLPTNPHDQRLRYAVLFFLVVDARAVALVVKASFARPMAPDLRPGHVLWKEHVAPSLTRALALLERSPEQVPLLHAVQSQARAWVQLHPERLGGGGCEVFPALPSIVAPCPQTVRRDPGLILVTTLPMQRAA